MVRSQHIDYLDGWRGLAIVFLLIGHFFPIPGIDVGAIGVQLFFALSGLLMARILFIQSVPLRTFFRRRISRIVPATYLFITVVVLCYLGIGFWSLRETASSYAFIANYANGGRMQMPLGHLWSLSVEEHSYVLLALVALCVRRRMLSATAVTGAIAALFAIIAFGYWAQNSFAMPFRLRVRTEVAGFGIFFSAFMALVLHRKALQSRVSALLVPLLLVMGIVLHWWSVPYPIGLVIGVGMFCMAVNLLAFSPPIIQALFALQVLRRLGVWSFSIYLWQHPFHAFFHRGVLSPGVALALGVTCGLMSFYLFEQPVREWLNRTWGSPDRISNVTISRVDPLRVNEAISRD